MCVCEGYFVMNHASLAGRQDLFAQLWKEYGLSDSRYLTSDPFMISVEMMTAVGLKPYLSRIGPDANMSCSSCGAR